MGCDIHSFVEKKEDGKWIAVKGPDPYSSGHITGGIEYQKLVLEGWIYSNRSYVFFGLLAGVRNGSIPPISEPKGSPEDMSEEVKEYIENDCDLHSHSYFTLKELEDAVIPESYVETGLVSQSTYDAYKEDGILPTSWCSWSSNDGYLHLSWERKICDVCGDSLELIIEKLTDVIGDGNHEDVRFVFAFDN